MPVPPTRGSHPARAVPRRRTVVFLLAIGGTVALAGGIFALLDAASLHFVAANSDGATVVLEGDSMRNGALLLSGWSLPLDSFFTIEVPLYAGAIAIFGLARDLVNAVPAALGTLVIFAGMAIAVRPGRGWARIAGAAVVVALLGLPSPGLAFFFLQGPWHVGTALFCLVAFAGAAAPRPGWRAAIATVALVAAILGDVQALALGAVPILVSGVLRSARARQWRAGALPVAIACGSVLLAYLLRKLFDLIGTFTLVDANPTARLHQVGFNLRHLPVRFAGLLGVGTDPIGPATTPSRIALAHVLGLAVVLGAVAITALGAVRGAAFGDRRTGVPGGSRTLDDLLLLGFVGDLGAFVLLAATGNGAYARYLTAGVIFSVVLAGRIACRAAGRSGATARAAAAGALGLCALFGVGYGLDLGQRAVPRPVNALGAYLESARLTEGLGDYWSASIVTASTGGRVTVRPVIATPGGTLARYGRQSTSAWYAGERFGFLVFDLHRPWRSVDMATAEATFGPPRRVLAEGTYRIYVFAEPVTISPIGYSNS